MKRVKSVINVMQVVEIIFIIGYLLVSWHSISNTIPSHFNKAGMVDGYGNKTELLMYPIVCIFLLFACRYVFTCIRNGIVKYVPQIKWKAYETILYVALQALGIYIVGSMAVLMGCSIQEATPGIWFSIFFVGGVLAILLITGICIGVKKFKGGKEHEEMVDDLF